MEKLVEQMNVAIAYSAPTSDVVLENAVYEIIADACREAERYLIETNCPHGGE